MIGCARVSQCRNPIGKVLVAKKKGSQNWALFLAPSFFSAMLQNSTYTQGQQIASSFYLVEAWSES